MLTLAQREKNSRIMHTTVVLSTVGTFTDSSVLNAPHVAGLYFVYKEDGKGNRKLLYIGEADDVNKRLNEHHEKRCEWNMQLLPGEDAKIIYLILTSPLLVSSHLRKSVENACVFKAKPTLNVQGKDEFCYGGFMKVVFEGETPAGFYGYFILFDWHSERMKYLLNLLGNVRKRNV